MQKKTKVLIALVLFLVILFRSIHFYTEMKRDSFLENVNGKIYYLKRDEGILKLYKSDADLKNEELIYSHYEKGETNFNSFRHDQIINKSGLTEIF